MSKEIDLVVGFGSNEENIREEENNTPTIENDPLAVTIPILESVYPTEFKESQLL